MMVQVSFVFPVTLAVSCHGWSILMVNKTMLLLSERQKKDSVVMFFCLLFEMKRHGTLCNLCTGADKDSWKYGQNYTVFVLVFEIVYRNLYLSLQYLKKSKKAVLLELEKVFSCKVPCFFL
jgi:hypothetical protein